jgi:hypothetical protein
VDHEGQIYHRNGNWGVHLDDFPSAWAGWELPGMIAALLTGPDSSNILVFVIIWAVNAVVYGLVAFAVILAIP